MSDSIETMAATATAPVKAEPRKRAARKASGPTVKVGNLVRAIRKGNTYPRQYVITSVRPLKGREGWYTDKTNTYQPGSEYELATIVGVLADKGPKAGAKRPAAKSGK